MQSLNEVSLMLALAVRYLFSSISRRWGMILAWFVWVVLPFHFHPDIHVASRDLAGIFPNDY